MMDSVHPYDFSLIIILTISGCESPRRAVSAGLLSRLVGEGSRCTGLAHGTALLVSKMSCFTVCTVVRTVLFCVLPCRVEVCLSNQNDVEEGNGDTLLGGEVLSRIY